MRDGARTGPPSATSALSEQQQHRGETRLGQESKSGVKETKNGSFQSYRGAAERAHEALVRFSPATASELQRKGGKNGERETKDRQDGGRRREQSKPTKKRRRKGGRRLGLRRWL
ncbi:hypothetical protein MHYP_G00041230 [Metynnis hypsauchen]